MAKKYIVTLTEEERERLRQVLSAGLFLVREPGLTGGRSGGSWHPSQPPTAGGLWAIPAVPIR